MKRFIRVFISLVAVAVFVFSAWQIYNILENRHTAKSHYSSYDNFIEKETDTTKNNKTEKENEPAFKVNFEKLTAEYPDITGWLYFDNAEISYPVMQGKDNSFYLTHLPDGTENSSGSIFADYRNGNMGEDDNFIIYGHNMKNDTMFGLLDEYGNQQYYEKHPCFYYLTKDKAYKADIIAGCVVSSTSDIYKTNFEEKKLSQIVKELVENSTFKSDVNYKKGDRLITLSTCSATEELRYVLVAVIL